jgi:hypothetical protein
VRLTVIFMRRTPAEVMAAAEKMIAEALAAPPRPVGGRSRGRRATARDGGTMRRTVFIAITAAPMATMLTNTAHAEASDVDFVQLELGFALAGVGAAHCTDFALTKKSPLIRTDGASSSGKITAPKGSLSYRKSQRQRRSGWSERGAGVSRACCNVDDCNERCAGVAPNSRLR